MEPTRFERWDYSTDAQDRYHSSRYSPDPGCSKARIALLTGLGNAKWPSPRINGEKSGLLTAAQRCNTALCQC